LMLLGFLKAFKKNLKIALFFLLIVLFNLFWSLNYGIKDGDYKGSDTKLQRF